MTGWTWEQTTEHSLPQVRAILASAARHDTLTSLDRMAASASAVGLFGKGGERQFQKRQRALLRTIQK